MRQLKVISAALGILLCSGLSAQQTGWYEPVTENKPFVRWWWLGSAVDKAGLTYNLEEFARVGIGGFEVTPIYGVKGNEANDIEYLSPKWMEMYDYLVSESERLGLECDLNNGTGWPFGGPQITPALAAKKMSVTPEGIEAVPTGQMVKRAAPGGEGFVMDHLNPEALRVYLDRFDKAFAGSGSKWPHTWFNDSYEVYGADWTPGFEKIFRQRYGYDIVPFLQRGPGSESYDRAIADYRELMGTLLRENFVSPWIEWCHSHGSFVRNQSHGSPANLLDVYGMVDIPECETYGRSSTDLPGLRHDPLGRPNDGDAAVLKLASSAAHVTGKKYVSCEALTWLTEHFRTSLSQCKPEIDRMFAAGVNHICFHGAPYSPAGTAFPGWLFYASVNMSPTGGMWKDAPAMFKYIERCQAFLSAGEPDSDFLLYFPVYDVWSSDTEKPYLMFDIHSMGRTLPELKAAMNEVLEAGYDADYISDEQLCRYDVTKPVIVPSCRYMPVETARRLVELRRKGVPVYFIGEVPSDVPGLHRLSERRREFRKAARHFGKAVSMEEALSGHVPEEFRSRFGGQMIRRKNEAGGWNYFATMLQDKEVDGWVKLAVPAASAMLYDAETGFCGKAQLREAEDGFAEIRLQLRPGKSVLIKTFPSDITAEPWEYAEAESEALVLDSGWSLSFTGGEPAVDGTFEIDKTVDWTTLDIPELKRYFGTGVYSVSVEIDDPKAAGEWVLDLGDVRESARVFVNSEYVGTAWCVPFRLNVGRYLKQGHNRIEIHVTNLQSNLIADYDRRGVEWRMFKDANVSTLLKGYKDYSGWAVDPSGLCSEVRLIPVMLDTIKIKSLI